MIAAEREHSANILRNRVFMWAVPERRASHGHTSPRLGCFSGAAARSYSSSSPQHLAQRHMSASSHSSIHEGQGLENQTCRRQTNGAALIERPVSLIALLAAQVNKLGLSHRLLYRTQRQQICMCAEGLESSVCRSPVSGRVGKATGR